MRDGPSQTTFSELSNFYADHLRSVVLPFWLRYGIDRKFGGVFNFLRNDGTIESSDKVLWSQARALWTFSKLYTDFDGNSSWLEIAESTARLLLNYGRDATGAWNFRISQEGKTLEPPQSIYVDAFAIYGLTAYARATGNSRAIQTALETYRRTTHLLRDHSALCTRPHEIPRGLQAHGPSMIFALVYHELGTLTNDQEILARSLELAEIVMSQHLKPEHKLLFEFVIPGGQLADGDAGQTFIPGHAIESMWFMERIYRYHNQPQRRCLAMEAIRWHLERGWDQEYSGLFLACHAEGGQALWHSPEAKVWWSITESLYALLIAYKVTGESWCLQWYSRVHDYAFRHFPNREHGDWFQNLDRRGQPIEVIVKGLPVKDLFHLPRTLIYGVQTLKELAGAEPLYGPPDLAICGGNGKSERQQQPDRKVRP